MFSTIRSYLLGLMFLFGLAANTSWAIDLDTDNAATQVVIPNAVAGIFDVSPTAGDASLVLRFTTMITNGWFDAIAPYHETAVGVYSDLGRRPQSENTNRNLNIAILYSSYHVLNSLFPKFTGLWRTMLENEGLDPDDDSVDLTSPIGLGNVAGQSVVAARIHDGMNQLGDMGDKDYHRVPYSDYTNFKPLNSAYRLIFPSKWQPAIVSDGKGLFRVQQFVTPQMRFVTPYSYEDPKQFRAPPPRKSMIYNYGWYVQQANEVLEASANMTDEQKMISELFDNKILSLGFSALFAAEKNGLGIAETVHYDFLTNMAAFDTAIAIWQEKAKYNAVRPHSAIEFLYGDSPVTAWGGVGQGTVTDLPAKDWTSYMPVADHPEYPSASASFCAAHAETSRLYFGNDELGYEVPTPAGSFRIEPGITPANDLVLKWDTWSEMEHDCGDSRYWSGVHFKSSVPAGQDIGHEIAQHAYDFVMSKLAGH